MKPYGVSKRDVGRRFCPCCGGPKFHRCDRNPKKRERARARNTILEALE